MTNSSLTAIIIPGCLLGAVLLGARVRRILPSHLLSAETRDTVKLTTGLVATMAALVLGLLVSSAKDSYDANRTQVIQMAAKITLLDRLLAIYGPDASEARTAVRATVEDSVARLWPVDGNKPAELSLNTRAGNSAYVAILRLEPRDNVIRSRLKDDAATLTVALGELRTLLEAQAVTSISTPLLVVVVCWLALIFACFTLLAPSNAVASAALIISVLSCSAAMLLILELDRPFSGLIRISSQPVQHALGQLAQPVQ